MPGRNIYKIYLPDTFYHVYNRGLNSMNIFIDDDDYRVFFNLLKRLLGKEKQINKKGRQYPNFHGEIELVSYCLMPNHYHLLIKTKDNPKFLAVLMQSVITSYVMYFNKRHKRLGPLFGNRYRAIDIKTDPQLWHITRYIHLNPLDVGQDYAGYSYSSIEYYLGKKSSDWVKPDEIMGMFNEARQDYKEFLEDYVERKAELKEFKTELY